MSPATQRFTGIIFILASAVFMVLNLRRVADLGSYWVSMPLLVIGVILVARAKRRT